MSRKFAPIEMTADEVRALMWFGKTQTRVPVTRKWEGLVDRYATGKIDYLWVQEPVSVITNGVFGTPTPVYRAEYLPHDEPDLRWMRSGGMPRTLSRLSLPIHAIWTQRLQDISEAECGKEGIPSPKLGLPGVTFATRKAAMAMLWNARTGTPHKWEENPKVFVIDHGVEYTQIDTLIGGAS